MCPLCGITDDNECSYGGWHGTQPFNKPAKFSGTLAVLIGWDEIEPCPEHWCPWPAGHRGTHGD